MEARKVTADHGWQWIKQGFAIFLQSPILWVALVAIGLLATVGLSSVPVIGDPLASLLFPTILIGYVMGCQALERGEELELAHLFAGFKQNAPALITLGGINLVGQFFILGVMKVTGGAALVSIMMSGQPVDDPAVLTQAMDGAGFALLLGGALSAVLLLAGQFAPMLAAFHGIAPIEAMRTSLRTCLSNIAPLSAYGAMMLLFAIAASMLAMLGWIVLLPVMLTSIYAAYRDLFQAVPEVALPVVEESNEPDVPPQV
ncbi:MAG: hypothetical protein HY849_05450 [Nitrosomonadales bacterium]|nr:hypothetical protein [Nitrosomonadales bacterium]